MIYLNVAGLSPFQKDVQQEIDRIHTQFSQLLYSEEGIAYYRQILDQGRETIASWLTGGDPTRIAFIPNTTTGSWLVLSRLVWNRGDVILTSTHENPKVLRQLQSLKNQGVHTLSLHPHSPDDFVTQIQEAVNSRPVRAILLSHVSQIDGRIFPLEAIGQLAKEHQIHLFIDGAQAVGHIPIDLQTFTPDAYFFPGYKWCQGPMGTGMLIFDRAFQKRLTKDDSLMSNGEDVPWMTFELGSQHLGLIAGLVKACQLKQHHGLQTEQLLSYRKQAKEAIQSLSRYSFLEWDGPHAPGILSLYGKRNTKETEKQKHVQGEISIVWKTFSFPEQPQKKGIRLSWSWRSTSEEIRLATDRLQAMSDEEGLFE